jgi:hypothetical protein
VDAKSRATDLNVILDKKLELYAKEKENTGQRSNMDICKEAVPSY